MSHPNLLKYYGVVVEPRKYIITEYHPGGSVYLLLRKAREQLQAPTADPKKVRVMIVGRVPSSYNTLCVCVSRLCRIAHSASCHTCFAQHVQWTTVNCQNNVH